MVKARIELESALYCRAGELAAHLGRYDMYALLVESTLSPSARVQSAPRVVLRTRGDSIKGLLRLRRIPQNLCDEFLAIDAEMQPILTRQDICASNVATIGRLNLGLTADVPIIPAQRDWFDLLNLSNPELASFIDRMELDAMQVINHYVRLAHLAAKLREIVARLH